MVEAPWYAQLREAWRPERVRLLLIAESAPDADSNDRRFFYAPTLTQHDNLFRGVVQALYEDPPLVGGAAKEPWLQRLRDDGVFLLDLAPYPVNKLPSGERTRTLHAHAPELVRQATALQPEGIIICHAKAYATAADGLRDAGLPVLHDKPIPFPLGNKRDEFVQRFRASLGRSSQQPS